MSSRGRAGGREAGSPPNRFQLSEMSPSANSRNVSNQRQNTLSAAGGSRRPLIAANDSGRSNSSPPTRSLDSQPPGAPTDSRDEQLKSLRAKIGKRDEQLNQQIAQIADFKHQYKRLEDELKAKDEQCQAELNARDEQQKAGLRHKDEQLHSKDNQIQGLQEKIDANVEQAKGVQARLDKKTQIVENTRKRIGSNWRTIKSSVGSLNATDAFFDELEKELGPV